MHSARRKRCKRYGVPGQAHCLTFSCYRRQPFFDGRRTPAWFCECLDAARRKEPFDLWGFVIMPEHAHVVLWPHAGSQISRILRFIKRPTTDRVLNWLRVNDPGFLPRLADSRGDYHLWLPGGGHDRNLRSVADVHEKIVYIHNNPVRRGLVSRPEDWPWSSYRAWRDGVDEPLRIDRQSLPPLVR